jgi:hypothetical protein
MASVIRKPRSKYWFACFRDLHGRQHRKSTEQTDRKKALEVAKHYELVAQRKIKPQKVRETLSQLYQDIYGQTVPVATLRQYVDDWLKVKEPETVPATIAGYRKSTTKFLGYLGANAERDISEITRTHTADFRNALAKKISPGTVNFDLKTLRMACMLKHYSSPHSKLRPGFLSSRLRKYCWRRPNHSLESLSRLNTTTRFGNWSAWQPKRESQTNRQ